jgi:RNA polymerase sigma-70 factor, ECF subfamily
MELQDRRRWDHALIAEGRWHLRRAERGGRPPGTYRLQAAIAHAHASAADAAATDWAAIVAAYDTLLVAQPSPIVALNRAIAIGFRDGPDAGLVALADVEARPDLPSYYVVAATRADFLRRAGRRGEAADAYRQAVDLAPTPAEVRALRRRLDELT